MNIFELTRILNETNEIDIQKSKRSLKSTTDWVVRKKIQELGSEPTQKKEKELSELEDNLDRAKSFIVSLSKQENEISKNKNTSIVEFLTKKKTKKDKNNLEKLRDVGITHSWITNFLNNENVSLDLSSGYHSWEECCAGLLSPNYVQRFFNLSKNNVGAGEFLIMMLALRIGKKASNPSNGQGGDIIIDGINYEIKGNYGRLDGTQIDDVADIIDNHKQWGFQIDTEDTADGSNKFPSIQTRENNLVNAFISAFFNGRNKSGKLLVVNTEGYYVIEQGQKITDGRIKITIPGWMRYYAYTKTVSPHNDNDRTIKISLL